MANLSVVSTTNSIKVDFGDTHYFQGNIGYTFSKGVWNKASIIEISLQEDNDFVVVETIDETEWVLSYQAITGAFVVDTVDAVAPTSNSDLYDKLVALIA